MCISLSHKHIHESDETSKVISWSKRIKLIWFRVKLGCVRQLGAPVYHSLLRGLPINGTFVLCLCFPFVLWHVLCLCLPSCYASTFCAYVCRRVETPQLVTLMCRWLLHGSPTTVHTSVLMLLSCCILCMN